MSDITAKFLGQLQEDLRQLADPSTAIGSRLTEMASRLDVVEANSSAAVFWEVEQGRFLVDASHPAVKALVNSKARRRTDTVFFISTLVSVLNRGDAEITDEHEREFHAKLLRFALENAQGSWI